MRKFLKNKKGVSAIVTTLIIGVIILILMVILWPRFGPTIIKFFRGSGPMDDQSYQKTARAFDVLKANIQSCTFVDDVNCVCKGWSNFPEIFYPDTILTINNPSKKMSLSVPTREIWETNFENVFEYMSLGLVKKEQTIYVYALGYGQSYQTNGFSIINITSSKTSLINAKDGSAGNYGLVSSEYFFKKNVKENGLPVLEIIIRAGRDDLSSLNSEISLLPACSNKRTQAILSFRKSMSSVTPSNAGQSHTITDLPEGYTIFLRKSDKTFLLLYKNQVVKEILFVDYITSANNVWGWMGISNRNVIRLEINDVSFDPSSNRISICSDSQKTELINGAKIELKTEGGNTCLSAT